MPQVDLSMNFEQVTEYYTGHRAPILRQYETHRIDSILTAKDTVVIGVDCYANHMSRWVLPDRFIGPYRSFLYNGGTMAVRMIRQPTGAYSLDRL